MPPLFNIQKNMGSPQESIVREYPEEIRPLIDRLAQNPNDRELQAVIADALMERGMPGGELFALHQNEAKLEAMAPDSIDASIQNEMDAVRRRIGEVEDMILRSIYKRRGGSVNAKSETFLGLNNIGICQSLHCVGSIASLKRELKKIDPRFITAVAIELGRTGRNNFKDPEFAALKPRRLWIDGGNLEELQSLVGSALSRSLVQLEVTDCANSSLGTKAAGILAEAPGLANLNILGLADMGIGDTGVKAIAGSKHLKNLLALDIAGEQVSADAVRVLLESLGPAGLKELYLSVDHGFSEKVQSDLWESGFNVGTKIYFHMPMEIWEDYYDHFAELAAANKRS